MTQAISVRSIRPAESRLIAAVCAAHMMSHYYMLMLAPLFAFIRADFNVSYTELALALTVFNVVSGVLQTPVGFLVDRIGARVVLIAGLALSSIAYAVAGIVDSYWVFIAMYGVAGLGNTVFHPADYSLLSHHTPPERLSQVFSFHTFAGIVGSAIAPVTLLYMQSLFGWRGAYLGAAIFGLIVLLVLIAQPEPAAEISACRKRQRESTAGRHRCRLAPAGDGADPAQSRIFHTDVDHERRAQHLSRGGARRVARNAAGDRQYGADRAARHERRRRARRRRSRRTHQPSRRSRGAGLAVGGVVTALVGLFDFPSAGLVLLMAFSGFCVGTTYPSRDMLVRAVTPPAPTAACSASSAPALISAPASRRSSTACMMDHGEPRAVFMLSAAVSIVCISTVTFGFSRREVH